MIIYKVIKSSFGQYNLVSSQRLFFKIIQKSCIPAVLHFTAKQCHTNQQPEEVEVYVGPLSRQIRSVKLFSLITSMSGLFAQPVIMERATEMQVSTAVIVGTCSFVGFFTFVTPLLLHWITRKYVTSISYNEKYDGYTASIYTLFLRKKIINFKPGEAMIPDVPGMFTSMTIRGIPLFVDMRFFSDASHYKKIMGYDKPMDFKLNESQTKI